MRVTSVEMQSPTLEEPIDFSLRGDDPKARYRVRAIAGLDAEEIIPKFYGWNLNSQNAQDGRYYTFGMKSRDIVIRISLNPRFRINESYSDLRDDLYRSISATRTGKVDLLFKSGATTVSHILGLITKFEVGYFEQLPEVQLTVTCDDPIFRGISPVSLGSSDLASSNPIVIGDSLSTAPHGFEMQITFNNTATDLAIQDTASNPNWKFLVTPSGGFANNDVLYFSSEFSNRYLYMVRSGVTTNLADKISPTSVWPTIFPGSNTFYFLDKSKFAWNSLSFYAAYWGV